MPIRTANLLRFLILGNVGRISVKYLPPHEKCRNRLDRHPDWYREFARELRPAAVLAAKIYPQLMEGLKVLSDHGTDRRRARIVPLLSMPFSTFLTHSPMRRHRQEC